MTCPECLLQLEVETLSQKKRICRICLILGWSQSNLGLFIPVGSSIESQKPITVDK
jgi:hypothetical protein